MSTVRDMTTLDLAGSTALVTGSTSGIGTAIAKELAQRGAHVLVCGRDAERGERVVGDLRGAGGRADFIPAELGGGAAAAKDLAARAQQVADRNVDILVNNAAVGIIAPTADMPERIRSSYRDQPRCALLPGRCTGTCDGRSG